MLRALIRGADNFKNAIIFCNRKRDVATLHRSLAKHGFNVGALHGDMDQRARTATLDDFRKDRIKLLVASDVAARGLDIPAVSHIFNFDVPTHAEDYIHRIGRTGRAGLTGTAITIATSLDRKYVAGIEKLTGQPIPPLEVEAAAERAAAFTRAAPSATMTEPKSEGRERHARGRGERRPRREASAEPRPAGAAAEPEPSRTASAGGPGRDTARPARSAPRPGHREPRRDSRPPRNDHRDDRPRRDENRHRDHHRDRDDGPPVVGLGDHVPEFLRRPVKVPSE